MPFFKVVRTDGCDWDEYGEVVVRADSAIDALTTVVTPVAYDWDSSQTYIRFAGFKADGSNAKVVPLARFGPTEIITASFNAG